MTEEDAEGFLARWSRRKRAAAAPGGAEQAAEPRPPAAAAAIAPAPAVLPEAPAEAAPDPAAEEPPPDLPPLKLPSIESLTAESDLRPFLDPRAPQGLRQAALRRMWSLDPAIRDFIGPADYAWDYNAPDGVPGFALELGGEVRRLLAQAIGLEAGPEAPREAPAMSTPPAEEPEEPPAAMVAPAPDPPPQAAGPPPPSPPGAEPLPPRRHGGARPA